MWRVTQQYTYVQAGQMDEEATFYINDEIGSAISHSDFPNVKMMPFIWSKNNTESDPDTIVMTIVWPT